jgi:coproporphyrinogen III oxidase-like Fe-S oxidoreductase
MRREGRLPLPSEDEARAQGEAIRHALRRAGLRRYEISNFARPGRASVHNRLYWEGESYLGLGAGAYGCLRGDGRSWRYGNLRGVEPYLHAALAGRLPTAEEDDVGPGADRNERLMLALRTSEGAPLEALSARQAREASEAVRRRLAVRRAGRLVLTSRGMDLHSALSERLFD